jgi:hypothetical protein
MKKIPMNPECASCPMRLTGCGEIMQAWRERRVRRPEFVALVGRLYAFHSGEMVCTGMDVNVEEVLKRVIEKKEEQGKS